jgi:RNA polymerase subunit RPABC4/transcription elongation factor Spt4
MSIPLLNARLCMDCDTIFEESRCPSCDSESYFPVSRWVRPAVALEKATVRKTAKKASMVLLGTGAAFALWKLLGKTDHKLATEGPSDLLASDPHPSDPHASDPQPGDPEAQQETGTGEARPSRVRKRKQGGGPDVEG